MSAIFGESRDYLSSNPGYLIIMEILVKTNTIKTIAINPRDVYGFDDETISCMANAVVTFSMLDESTGCYVVANRPGELKLLAGDKACGIVDEIELRFQLTKRHTKKRGVYRGEFRVEFINEPDRDSLIIPTNDTLEIIITDSATASAFVGPGVIVTPPVVLPTPDTGAFPMQRVVTLQQFNALVASVLLIPGMSYLVVLDSMHTIVVTAATGKKIMPLGKYIVDGVESLDAYKVDIINGGLAYEIFDILPPVLTSDILVSLSSGKTLGRYLNGETIPATGKTPAEVFLLLAQEPIAPTVVSFTTSLASPQPYNQTALNNVLSWTYVINSLGGVLQNVKLERSRDNSTWVVLVNGSIDLGTYSDTGLNIAVDNSPIYYRLTVTDSLGGVTVATRVIVFLGYVAPSVTLNIRLLTREQGDVSTTITGSINRNSLNVALLTYQLQYSSNGSSWFDLSGPVSISGASAVISGSHNDAAFVNNDALYYRVKVTDSRQETISGVQTISFQYKSFLGYSPASVLSVAEIIAFPNGLITNSRARVINGITAQESMHTYYAYRAGAGDLDSAIVISGGLRTEDQIGAFDKLSDVTGLNAFGATVTMRVYKSRSTQAFTNTNLEFI